MNNEHHVALRTASQIAHHFEHDVFTGGIKPELLRNFVAPGIYLKGAWLPNADLSYSDLSNADMRETQLHGADLHSANLESANFHGAKVQLSIFKAKNIEKASNLHFATLHHNKDHVIGIAFNNEGGITVTPPSKDALTKDFANKAQDKTIHITEIDRKTLEAYGLPASTLNDIDALRQSVTNAPSTAAPATYTNDDPFPFSSSGGGGGSVN